MVCFVSVRGSRVLKNRVRAKKQNLAWPIALRRSTCNDIFIPQYTDNGKSIDIQKGKYTLTA